MEKCCWILFFPGVSYTYIDQLIWASLEVGPVCSTRKGVEVLYITNRINWEPSPQPCPQDLSCPSPYLSNMVFTAQHSNVETNQDAPSSPRTAMAGKWMMITTILLNIQNLTAEPQHWLQLWTFPSAVTKSLAVSSGLITAEPGGFLFHLIISINDYPSTHIQYRDCRSFLANLSQASLSMQVRHALLNKRVNLSAILNPDFRTKTWP